MSLSAVPENSKISDKFRLNIAGNETAEKRLRLFAGKDLKNLRLSVSKLTAADGSEIPVSAVDLRILTPWGSGHQADILATDLRIPFSGFLAGYADAERFIPEIPAGECRDIILLILPIVVICGIYLEKLAIDINMLSSGDDVASNLGISVEKLRNRGLVLSTLMTTVCIAFTGTIGFVGLMAPHLCRMIIGNDSRYLFPAAGLMGAFILLISDIASRLIMRPSELPIGIIMYIVGGIFFIWLVFGKKLEGRE